MTNDFLKKSKIKGTRVPWRRGGVATPFGVPQVLTIKDWEVVEFKDQKTDILQKKLALIVDDDQKLLLNKENTRTCQGRSKIRPPWRRKTRPLGSWVEWRNAAVRRERQDAGVAAGGRAFLLCSRR